MFWILINFTVKILFAACTQNVRTIQNATDAINGPNVSDFQTAIVAWKKTEYRRTSDVRTHCATAEHRMNNTSQTIGDRNKVSEDSRSVYVCFHRALFGEGIFTIVSYHTNHMCLICNEHTACERCSKV